MRPPQAATAVQRATLPLRHGPRRRAPRCVARLPEPRHPIASPRIHSAAAAAAARTIRPSKAMSASSSSSSSVVRLDSTASPPIKRSNTRRPTPPSVKHDALQETRRPRGAAGGGPGLPTGLRRTDARAGRDPMRLARLGGGPSPGERGGDGVPRAGRLGGVPPRRRGDGSDDGRRPRRAAAPLTVGRLLERPVADVAFRGGVRPRPPRRSAIGRRRACPPRWSGSGGFGPTF